MEWAPQPLHAGSQLDTRDDISQHRPVVGELGDACTVREELSPTRSKPREGAATAKKHETQPVLLQPLGHAAAIDQAQLEHAPRAGAPDRQRARVEAPHDPAADMKNDDDADPQPQPDPAHAERPRRQECECDVISWRGVPWQLCHDMEPCLRARRDPESPRPQPEPGHRPASRLDSRPAAQRAGEAGPWDVDAQCPLAGVPHGDDWRRAGSERHAQRACAEADPAAGRGTRDGCRGRCEDYRRECASHRPITVYVNVAV